MNKQGISTEEGVFISCETMDTNETPICRVPQNCGSIINDAENMVAPLTILTF